MKNFSSKAKVKAKAKEICCFFVCLFVFGLVLCAMIDLIDWFKKCRVDDYWVSEWVSEWVVLVLVLVNETRLLFSFLVEEEMSYNTQYAGNTRPAKLNFSFISFFFWQIQFNVVSTRKREKHTHYVATFIITYRLTWTQTKLINAGNNKVKYK